MEFSKQEYCSGLPFPFPGDPPNPRIKPASPALPVNSLPLKDDAVKVLHSICQQIWKTQQRPQDWKRSVFIPIPKKDTAKECSNYRTIALISHASKVMLKILQARLQQYMNHELPRCSSWFLKRQRNQRSNCQHLMDHGKSKRIPEKNIYFCFIDYAKAFDCVSIVILIVSQLTVENSSRDGSTRPLDLPLEKPVCRSGSNS